jgi:hypothetical protein
MKKMLIVIAALMLGACATGYQAKGFGGGYSDVQVDENTYRVTFEGKGTRTSKESVENMMLYRAAELTKQKGYDWFTVNDRDGDEKWNMTYGRVGVSATATIQMFKGKKPENALRSYDAQSVIDHLGKSLKISG